ncbi:MAG: hypothetical protein K6F33_09350 [Bacteroidales bacterium]|nr:hypothetical protein [Bacteroidales bacterium]
MNFLQGVRENWGHKILRRKAKKVSRSKTYNNLESAQTVGILFDASIKSDTEDVKKLVDELHNAGKRIDALGMLGTKEELAVAADKVGLNFFAANDCTFFCFPKGVSAVQFISQKFDILLNVCPTTSLTSDYIVAMSKAKFKVSTRLGDEAYADFILQFATGPGADGKPRPMPSAGQIINAIKQYLSNIAKA